MIRPVRIALQRLRVPLLAAAQPTRRHRAFLILVGKHILSLGMVTENRNATEVPLPK